MEVIIRFGGLVPLYYAGNNFTCHPSEAVQMSLEDARKLKFNTTRGVSLRNSENGQFIESLNW